MARADHQIRSRLADAVPAVHSPDRSRDPTNARSPLPEATVPLSSAPLALSARPIFQDRGQALPPSKSTAFTVRRDAPPGRSLQRQPKAPRMSARSARAVADHFDSRTEIGVQSSAVDRRGRRGTVQGGSRRAIAAPRRAAVASKSLTPPASVVLIGGKPRFVVSPIQGPGHPRPCREARRWRGPASDRRRPPVERRTMIASPAAMRVSSPMTMSTP